MTSYFTSKHPYLHELKESENTDYKCNDCNDECVMYLITFFLLRNANSKANEVTRVQADMRPEEELKSCLYSNNIKLYFVSCGVVIAAPVTCTF